MDIPIDSSLVLSKPTIFYCDHNPKYPLATRLHPCPPPLANIPKVPHLLASSPRPWHKTQHTWKVISPLPSSLWIVPCSFLIGCTPKINLLPQSVKYSSNDTPPPPSPRFQTPAECIVTSSPQISNTPFPPPPTHLFSFLPLSCWVYLSLVFLRFV